MASDITRTASSSPDGEADTPRKAGIRAPWNPLVIHGTPMQPSLLLMSKFVVLCFIVEQQFSALPFHLVPFVDFLRHVGTPSQFHHGLQVVFGLAAISLFFNRWVRAASIVAGGVVLLGIASSIPFYENNRLYCGLILVLAGLNGPEDEPWLLRFQVVLLYFAAALNKVLLVDWRAGYFMDAWLRYPGFDGHAVWAQLAGHFPPRVLATFLSWAAIVTEFALAVGFAVKKLWPLAIWLGIAYHTTLTLSLNRTFGMFWFAAPASYLAFVRWPDNPATVRFAPGNICWRLLRRIDFEGAFDWQPTRQGGLELETARGTYRSWRAGGRVLLRNPVTYFAFAVVAAQPRVTPRISASVVMLVLLAVAVDAVLEALQRRTDTSRTPAVSAA